MLEFNFHPFPELRTERLHLKRMTESDDAQIFALRNDERVMRYIDRPRAQTIDDARVLIELTNETIDRNEGIVWGIYLHSSPLLIGNLGFWRTDRSNHRAEIGYVLLPEYWQQGIISEAVTAVINFGFEKMNLHSIEANVNPANKASIAVIEKAKFKQEAYFRENFYFEGKFLDSVIFGLLASEW